MKYRGEVTFSLISKFGTRTILTKHNDAEIGLQLAFSNMLAGLKAVQWVPAYVEYNDITYIITGRNKRVNNDITKSSTGNPKYYVEFNAFIPVDNNSQAIEDMLGDDAQYTVCGQGYSESKENIYKLASIKPEMSPERLEEVKESLRDNMSEGLQLNINWKMFLEVEEE